MSELNLYQKINKVMSSISYVQKTGNIQAGKSSYSAVLHDHVTQLVQPHFVEHGLVAIPNIIEHDFLKYTVVTKYGEADRYETQVKVELEVVNADNPDERLKVTAVAQGLDQQDKAPGKAYSMAVKYCYLKLLMLASGDQEEDRVEQAKIMKKTRDDLAQELRGLLGSAGKLTPEADVAINRMNINQITDKISQYK